jgi:DNA-binding CsgD family transcriptional regulator
MRGNLDHCLDRLSAVHGLNEAAAVLVEIAELVGVDRPSAVEDFSQERLLMSKESGLLGEIFGWLPSRAPQGCDEPLHHVCPIGRACRVAMSPFVWRSAEIGAAAFAWDRRTREFWQHVERQGIYGGITVPIHMPMSRVGAVGWLAVGREPDLEDILARWGNPLRLASHLFMDHVYRERLSPSAAAEAALTERELECLTWVALGKTDSEIGELIGRSPSTARFHVESAVGKLGVNNRTRAAAVACQLGMIRALA